MELLRTDEEWQEFFKNFKKKPKKIKQKKKRKPRRQLIDIKKLGQERLYVKYKDYIRSKWWAERKRLYYKTHPKKCAACQSRSQVGIHHLSYENIGYEKDEDLVALCWRCHANYHDQYGKEDMVESTHTFIIHTQEEQELYELAKRL